MALLGVKKDLGSPVGAAEENLVDAHVPLYTNDTAARYANLAATDTVGCREEDMEGRSVESRRCDNQKKSSNTAEGSVAAELHSPYRTWYAFSKVSARKMTRAPWN